MADIPSVTVVWFLHWSKVLSLEHGSPNELSSFACWKRASTVTSMFRISHCRYQPIRLQSNWSIVKLIPNFHSVTSSSCWGCPGLVCTISIRGVRSDFRRQLMKNYIVGQEKLPKTSERKIPQSTIWRTGSRRSAMQENLHKKSERKNTAVKPMWPCLQYLGASRPRSSYNMLIDS